MRRRATAWVAAVAALVLGGTLLRPQSPSGPAGRSGHAEPAATPGYGDVEDAVARRARDVWVQGHGEVVRLLADDRRGSRHQRFLLRLPAGGTVLVAHNIDLAPRLEALRAGDRVDFAGEYVWNDKGGVLHWTHDDPEGRHDGGWLRHGGRLHR